MRLTCAISELRVHAVQENGDWLWIGVAASVYYRILRGQATRADWDAYHELLKKYQSHTYDQEISYEGFRELCDMVEEKGFDAALDPVTIDCGHPLHVLDGQHRLCVLLHLVGNVSLTFRDSLLCRVQYNGLN